ncbi:hypothetical protein [Saccharopolyspora elongata]|nr:hypothetical protein [Saccharopolyspora elongata]
MAIEVADQSRLVAHEDLRKLGADSHPLLERLADRPQTGWRSTAP